MDFEKLNQVVQEVLGTSLEMNSKGSVKNLNDIPQKLIENTQKLEASSGLDAMESYLKFYADEKDWKYVRPFVHQVVLPNKDAKTWRKGRTLHPDISLRDLLTKEKEVIYGDYIHKIQFIKKPAFDAWNKGSNSIGGFEFPEPEADYRSVIPKGFLPSEMVSASLLKIDPADTVVLFRRWIAIRIASYLKAKNFLDDFPNSNTLEEVAPKNTWTKDALKAWEGLIKEKASGIWKDGQIPGNSGPEEFYI